MRVERFSFLRSVTGLRSLVLAALLPLLMVAASGLLISQVRSEDNDHVTWTILTKEVSGKPGDKVDIKVKAKIVSGAHLYTTKTYPDSVLGPSPTEVTVGAKGVLSRVGGIRSTPNPTSKFDEAFELNTEYWTGTVTLTVPARISKSASEGNEKGWVEFYFQTCTETFCRPPSTVKLEFGVVVEPLGEEVADVDSIPAETGEDTAAMAAVAGDSADDGSDSGDIAGTTAGVAGDDMSASEEKKDSESDGIWAYLLVAMLSGFGALFTPCVFPMIPITVSFFTKREQKSHAQAVKDAGVFAFGIIGTFTALGAVVAAVWGASAIGSIATNPFINILIAGIFITFALSLFGLFEIQIPSSILNKLNAKANEGSGFTSIILMGLVFSLTSFTCTVPFVGPALMSFEEGQYLQPIFGMLAFSTIFATPFFLLAIFPSLMKALPKSGGWLNAVKVVMGFVEIAAAMKFLSNVDLVLNWGWLTREIVLSIWIAIAILASMYLLGRFRLPHDSPTEKIGVMRMLFSMGFMAISFWFLTGLFGAQLGEIDAFLPPQEYPEKGNTSVLAAFNAGAPPAAQHESGEGRPELASNMVEAEGMVWYLDDYAAALEESKRTGKPIFTDFTGYTCTNCRWMETNVFTREDVRNLMNQYVLARLYTDRREPANERNKQMQKDRFRTVDLPLYAVMSSEDEIISHRVFTRDVDEFKNFLKRGLAEAARNTGNDRAEEMAIR